MRTQSHPEPTLAYCVSALVLALAACSEPAPAAAPAADLGGTSADASAPAGCAAETQRFQQALWPQVLARCVVCHQVGGAAAGTRFTLRPVDAKAPDAATLSQDQALFRAAAQSLVGGDGAPLLLAKPSAQVAHGGGAVLQRDSADYALLATAVGAARSPTASCDVPSDPQTGVTLLDAAATLRKAALQIAARPPTLAEQQKAQQGGLAALDPLLSAMMDEPAFAARVREIFNDLLLTDANLYEQSADGVIANGIETKRFPNKSWYGNSYNVNTRRAADAVAREPLEFVVHALRTGRPLTEIVTAQYRLVNPSSAKVYGLSPTFKDPNDADEFVEVQIPLMHGESDGAPGEYAGILTTTSFQYRYPNTGTNRNRKRARYFYKLFLNYDIMKTAQRLDLSLVDFNADPWRNNRECIGCHAAIDAVAGAFMNWTNCYDGMPARYILQNERYCDRGPNAWWPADKMFAPGTGAGAAAQLSAAQLPLALKALGQSVVGNPGFAEAMAGAVLGGLTGWPVLPEPGDVGAADYAAQLLAYDNQQALIKSLARSLESQRYDLKKLVIATVKSPAFRLSDADRPGRLELLGQGGGTLTPPEVLHRKINTLLGAPWGIAGSLSAQAAARPEDPFHLLAYDKLRLPYGGIESRNVLTRQRLPSSLAAATSQRMAYEMSCEYTALDFTLPAASRRLFPDVERTQTPSGDPAAQSERAIVANLQHLHRALLGEELAADSAELKETYKLLYTLYQDGQAALRSGTARVDLGSCAAKQHFATGQAVVGGFSDDSNYMVRAWQGVVAYLLLDYKFLFE